MKSRVLFLFVGALLSVQVFAQLAPIIEWQRNYGGSDYEQAKSIVQTFDGGYIVAGTSESLNGDVTNAHGNRDCWLLKLDIAGTMEWERSYGGSADDRAEVVAQCSDGGYVFAGSTKSLDGDVTVSFGAEDLWVVKLDDTGTIEWERSMGGTGREEATSLVQTEDGGYVVAGYTNSNNGDVTIAQGSHDYWIIKLDANGDTQWQRSVGGSGSDIATTITLSHDGGYIVAGQTYSTDGDVSNNLGDADYWVVKVNDIGNIEWDRSFGGSDFDSAVSMAQTSDGGYVIAGHSLSTDGDVTNAHGFYDFWIVKLDGSGILEWEKTLGGSGDEIPYSIVQTSDRSYIVAGHSGSTDGDVTNNHGDSDCWVVKLNDTGTVQWESSFGGSLSEYALSVALTYDGGYLVAGSSSSTDGDVTNNNGYVDYWVLKLRHDFNSITGTVFGDLNSNGSQDMDEPSLGYHNVHLLDASRQSWATIDGSYRLNVFDTGTFDIQAAGLTYFVSAPITRSVEFTEFQRIDSLNTFALQPIGIVNDLVVSIAPTTAFRPGFSAQYTINYMNIGTTALAPTIQLTFDPDLTFNTASIAPTSVSTNFVSWELPGLGPLTEGSLTLTVDVSQDAVLNSVVSSPVTIIPLVGDEDDTNNSALWPVVVTGSYDPNDIQVDRTTLEPDDLVSPPDLNYLIRFQNTGTDTAFTVRVDDVLPPGVQFSSLQYVGSSHPMEIAFENSSNKLRFQFNNILLPDSNTNEAASHGFVWYRIKPVATLQLGDSILNQAAIYFDYNEPVITNTAYTVIEQSTSIAPITATEGFTLFPNPAKGSLLLRTSDVLLNATLTLTDALGREVLSEKMNSTTHTLDVGELPRGMYLVTLRSAKGMQTQQVVLE